MKKLNETGTDCGIADATEASYVGRYELERRDKAEDTSENKVFCVEGRRQRRFVRSSSGQPTRWRLKLKCQALSMQF